MSRSRPRGRRHAAPLAAALALALLPGGLTATAAAAAPPQRSAVIVQLKPGTDAAAMARDAAGATGRVHHVYGHAVVGFAATLPTQAIDSLRRHPNVIAVEPDRRVQLFGTQSPTPSWGLDRVDQAKLPLSSSFTWTADGRGVDAYVVDTGIRPDHTDLGGRVRTGFTAVADGKGTTDCNGHGTHVAGTVGGTAHGIAKAVTLVPVRVLDCDGSGTYSQVIAGLDYAAKDHLAGVPAVAILSLGGPASSPVDAAVQGLITDGVSVVVAAGNSDTDACDVSPARVGPAITVGATTMADSRAPYSNHGACLDLFAPGSAIVSTWPTTTTSTATLSGTSMAAPHVAGAAALILSAQPALSPAAVTDSIITTSTTGVVTSAGPESPNRLLRTSAEGTFQAIAPVRVLDTRSGLGGRTGTLGQQESMTFDPALGGAIPTSGVSAVLLNVTGTEPTQPTHIRVWPTGTPLPSTSSVNLERGQSRPNQVVVPVGADGKVALFNNTGSTHLVVDVQGYYATAAGVAGGGYHPTEPVRVMDTREFGFPLEPAEEALFYVSAPQVDWSTVVAVDVNLTVTEPTTPGHITAWDGVGAPPSVSNVNFAPGQTVANHAVVPVDFDAFGEPYIVVRNSDGFTHLIIDVQGWYDNGNVTDGLRFSPSTTSRVADSRVSGTRVAAGGTLVVPGTSLPSGAVAHVVNVTATGSTGPGHLTAWGGEGDQPATSTVNYARAEDSPNLATVRTGADGRIAVSGNSSASHVVVDHIGYFWSPVVN